MKNSGVLNYEKDQSTRHPTGQASVIDRLVADAGAKPQFA
jgi:hypothetical protein